MDCRLVAVFCFCIQTIPALACSLEETDFSVEDRLTHCLLTNRRYPFMRPANSPNETVVVSIASLLYNIESVNEADETVTLIEWLTISYMSELYQWNPDEYENITRISVPVEKIWQPDIKLPKARLMAPLDEYAPVKAEILYFGMIVYYLPRKVILSCALDIREFPYDVQNCKTRYISFTEKLELLSEIEGDQDIAQVYNMNREWTLLEYSAITGNVKLSPVTNMYYVEYSFKVAREPSFYINAYVLPSFLITTIAIIGLFSPSEHTLYRNERISLGATALLALAVVFSGVFKMMPPGSKSMPRLGVYLLNEVYIVVLSTTMGALIMHLNAGLQYYGCRRLKPLRIVLEKNSLDEGVEVKADDKNGHSSKSNLSIYFYCIDVVLMAAFLTINYVITAGIYSDKQHEQLLNSTSVIAGDAGVF